MALPSSGSISLGQVNTELGVSATATRSLGETTTRNLFGVSSGAISMSQGYGKANQFAFTISSNVSNANLRTLAVNAGWNQSSKVVATIASGVYVSASSTGNVGLTIDGSFPGGVELVNNGYITGMGGNGGGGGSWNGGYGGYGGGSGSAGGKAMHVATAVTITNNSTIGGGGGGGGGGGSGRSNQSQGFAGGGGGGGGRTGATNSSGGGGGWARVSGGGGSAGTGSSAGGGGGGGYYWGEFYGGYGGSGGTGGNWGAGGNNGNGGNWAGGGSGGGAGACLSGNSYITWAATGTRNGSIS